MRSTLLKVGVLALSVYVTGAAVAQSRDVVALRGPRPTAEAAYREISEEPALSTRKEIFRTLSPETRADLWLLHLEKFLVDHPDLTVAQRDVIVEAIGILATSIPGRRVNGIARHHADGRMERFAALARVTLPRELFVKAFVQLGPPIVRGAASRDPLDRWKVTANPIRQQPDCDCSDTDDFCDSVTNPWPYCNAENPCKPISDSCGWWWAETCDGLCSPMPDGCEGC